MDLASTQKVVPHHEPPHSFIRKYIFSLDHKVIGKQYLGLGLLAAFVGMALSWRCGSTWAGPTCRFRFWVSFRPTVRRAA